MIFYCIIFSFGSGRGSSKPILIEVLVILDNRILGRAVKKIALEDFGLQI